MTATDETGTDAAGEAAAAASYALVRADGAVPEGGILSRTVASVGGVRVTLFGFAEGEELTEHTSTRPALVLVSSGLLRATVAGDELELRPGDVLRMEARVVHGLAAVRPSIFTLVLLPAERS